MFVDWPCGTWEDGECDDLVDVSTSCGGKRLRLGLSESPESRAEVVCLSAVEDVVVSSSCG